ncbi:mitochondrial 2-oxoglutarate/malate carrier protein-like [Neodiprion virginianus]|uniref:Mitochondrial 2-oxoglutarate/malate carrier protein-like n=1 Tax=Neodiprion lecontei TaxID=441921 RepID=A0A6J0BTP7_NEOLC|nr:mitochondrial 2-oxoglutarate/malate carrier protein-like [Neodiprion lecontei]XP_046436075.1 mitochondrial 2-oxoglutarate/malate carrier protein-like [Neodiprion fabricii]XP_046624892.1 mitochondrial 2-oxoglutarate/malate carrier protein-like [Neodiprion virginianus]
MTEQKNSTQPSTPKQKSVPPVFNFINGGLSGMLATCVVHPMDVLKNRMQLNRDGTSIVMLIKSIMAEEGLTKFYRGLTAGLVRQATYTTTRLGIYNHLLDMWKANKASPPSFMVLCTMGMTAGVCGAFVGTPAEIALVRMSADGRLPPDHRRNYKHVFDAFFRIYKDEGITALWRGCIPTMGRAAVVNVSQLATYSQAKKMIVKTWNVKEGIPLHFWASMVSGLLTSFNSMPFDIAKTRIQNLKVSVKPPSMMSVITKTAQQEGITALWKGFVPTYCRIGPHTVLTFMINEQLTKLSRQYFV